MELINQLEVTVGEGNHIYGRRSLTKMMEKRTAQRHSLFLQIATFNQRQAEAFRRIEETRATLSSTLVLLRQRFGKTLELPPEISAREITQQFGLFRVEGTPQESSRRAEKPAATEKEKTRE